MLKVKTKAKTKRNEKRSRAITQIIAENGKSFWFNCSISKKDSMIKSKIAENDKSAKKGRTFMKKLNKKYCGGYSQCS